MSLIRQNWHDSDDGQAFAPPTRAEVERMSSREVSGLIDDLSRSTSGGGRSSGWRRIDGSIPFRVDNRSRSRRRR